MVGQSKRQHLTPGLASNAPCGCAKTACQEEEERAEERRLREEEAKALLEEEAKGEAQWAVVQEKLEQDREVRSNGYMQLYCEGVARSPARAMPCRRVNRYPLLP